MKENKKTNHSPVVCDKCGSRKVRFAKEKKTTSKGDRAQTRTHLCNKCR